MDWKEDIMSNMWVFPKGMERNGEVGPNSLKWTSKYGSVIMSGYDISTTDGINERIGGKPALACRIGIPQI